ncbi:MAG: hypothetical protein HGA87_03625 [Desulfobulbaceae bacterium]|nr:hypothetical protein [Desulfobulbaceae bacterium]
MGICVQRLTGVLTPLERPCAGCLQVLAAEGLTKAAGDPNPLNNNDLRRNKTIVSGVF